MRWEDERYVRVYTRDTGDWLALSFAAQALFLMLLRKVDRIGELRLGRRGVGVVPAMLGHPNQPGLDDALRELLADGCVRLNEPGDVLFVPNFLKAQETAKSPAERKREQRERDAAKALENTQLSRDVTKSRDGHEMSPHAVPNHAVPCRAEPVLPVSAVADPVGSFGGMPVQQVIDGALPDRRADNSPLRKKPKTDKPPNPRHAPMVARLVATFLEIRGVAYAFAPRDAKALSTLLGMGSDEEIDQRWRRGLLGQFRERCDTLSDLLQRWNALTGAPQAPPGRVVDLRKSPVRAEDVNQDSFKEVGRAEF